MSKVICIAGESGSGKTTAMRTLNPDETYYIDADKKGLPWKGWKTQYNSTKQNYKPTSNISEVQNLLYGVSLKKAHVKVIVVDTLNALMIDDEFVRMKEKGYDKWQDLAMGVWGLISEAYRLRDDLTVVFTAHTQTERDDSGFTFTRIRTSGKKLDKIVLESKFSTVLIAKCIDGRHVFETRANNSTAKSPMGAFENFEIDNDIVKVIKGLEEY